MRRSGLAMAAAVLALSACGGPGPDQLAAGPAGIEAEVPRGAEGAFAGAGINLQDLPGKLVRIRGLMRPGSGEGLLTLDHPEQIEVLQEK